MCLFAWVLIAVLLFSFSVCLCLYIEKQERAKPLPIISDVSFIKAHSQGYHTLMADIIWLSALQYNDYYDTGHYIEQYADTLIALDPQFKSPYRWAFLRSFMKGGITPEGIVQSNHYLTAAQRQFPEDPEFPYLLGLNMAVYDTSGSPQERRRKLESGIASLQKAYELPNSPEYLPLLSAGLLKETAPGAHCDYMKNAVYAVRDSAVRSQLELIISAECR